MRERERECLCVCARKSLSPAVPFNGRNGCCSCFSARTSPRSMWMNGHFCCLRDKKKKKTQLITGEAERIINNVFQSAW